MKNATFDAFIETLHATKNVGGNYYFEQKLFLAINKTGKSLDDLTVREFLQLHDQVNQDYNELFKAATEKK